MAVLSEAISSRFLCPRPPLITLRAVPKPPCYAGYFSKNTNLNLQRLFTLTPRKRRMKSEFTFFSFSIVIIPTRLLCQMQVNSSGAQLLSTTSKFIKRKKILSLLVSVFHQLELTTGIIKREIKHFHVVVV